MDIWTGVETTYIKIRCGGIGKAFFLYDGVTISGLKNHENEQLRAIDGPAILYGQEDDAIVVIENVKRHLEEGKTPVEATQITMQEIVIIHMTDIVKGKRFEKSGLS